MKLSFVNRTIPSRTCGNKGNYMGHNYRTDPTKKTA